MGIQALSHTTCELFGLGESHEPTIVLLTTAIALLSFLLEFLRRRQRTHSDETPREDSAPRHRQAMLDKVRAIWITGVLDQSLYQEMRIALDLRKSLESVDRPMDILVQRPGQADELLPSGTRILDVYDAMDRALLILGAPGSGKTTTLLELLRDLLSRAEEDKHYPIPVVFPLSTWAEQELPLEEWLVGELQRRYLIGSELAHRWVEQDQILPLLDGLDEVAEAARGNCIGAINAFRQGRGFLPLVICSRIAEYETASTQLQLEGAIVIQPLSREQAGAFLVRGGSELASVRQALRDDETLWELLDTPLMLNIFALTYAGQPVAALQARGSVAAWRRDVFAAYASRMYRHRPSSRRYRDDETKLRLSWLAQQMMQHGQTVFYLEWIRPAWLATRWQQIAIRVGTIIISGLLLGLFFGLVFGSLFGLVVGLVVGPVFGLFFGLVSELRVNSDEPFEVMRWSWSEARTSLVDRLVRILVGGLVVGLVVGLVAWLVGGQGFRLIDVLVGGLYGGLLYGLGAGSVAILDKGFVTEAMASRSIPNEGTYRALRNARYSGLVFGLVFGLFLGLVNGLFFGLFSGLGFGLVGVLFGGLLGGLTKGGSFCLQHFLLRFMLFRNKVAPWRYVEFLDYAADRILLRKVGGGYMFIHRYLLEYFASLDTDTKHSI